MIPLYVHTPTSEEIISPQSGKSTVRVAMFLNPIAKDINQAHELPKHPFSDIFPCKNLENWPINVQFTGWNNPQKNWERWFNRLLINHANSWIETGIIDGIHASLHEIPCNKELVLGISEFWCPKTSSFIFPWGEATITLEDVMILGGFSVFGESHNKPIEENMEEIEFELRRAKREISAENYKSGGKRVATHDAWLQHFMEEEEEGEIDNEEGKFEHVAFLSLWLSRFVLPDINEGIIENYVFPIAVHLSKCTPIALAPVVLANLYSALTLLTRKAIELPLGSTYFVSGLFKIVQLWVCERFPEFGASLVKPLRIGDPRVARWDNVNFKVTLPFVRSRLKSGEGFRWRPYASDLENWEEFSYYKESEQVISNCAALDDRIDHSLPFARFLYPCELIGHQTNCKERYQPHRVAMQFGYDQDLPGEFTVSDIDWDSKCLYIPSKSFNAGMSRSYYNWWKNSTLVREKTVVDYFGHEKDKGNVTRSTERYENEPCKKGNSACASLKPLPKTPASSSLDHVPLALRVSPTVEFKKPSRSTHIKKQKSRALESPQVRIKPHCDSNIGNEGIVADKKECSDYSDIIDHMPLALRIQVIGQSREALKESYDSTENVSNANKDRNRPEELVSGVSDADSHITRKGSTPENTSGEADREVEDNETSFVSKSELLARLANFEKMLVSLGVAKLGDQGFSDAGK